ncbi:MAG: AI-2E family transporter [Planctomycetota bacterium]
MKNSVDATQQDQTGRRVTDLTIRLLLVAGLVYSCFRIFSPFLMPLAWGIVLAVAFSQLFFRMVSLLGGRRKLAGILFIMVGIGVLALPTWFLAESFFDGLNWLKMEEQQGGIRVPPPPESVANWPFIGGPAHQLWMNASESLEATLSRFGPQVKSLSTWLLSKLSGFGLAFLLTIVSIIISGVMLINAQGGGQTLRAIGSRIAGERGREAVDLAAQAVRSVAYGVVGVALVQAVLSAIGLALADVPGAGLWAGLIMVLAVAQLPPLLILGPAIVYVASTSESTMVLVIFAAYSLIVSFSDAVLKPLLLGRGMDIPMPVILIGAIGGMIRAGVIGLFVGAAVMAIGYKLYVAWMTQGESSNEGTAAPQS